MEKLKTGLILNNEILDLNCRVLKMREEERAAFNIRQQRQINRFLLFPNNPSSELHKSPEAFHHFLLAQLTDGCRACRLCDRYRRLKEKYADVKESQRKERELLEKEIQQLTTDNDQLERKFNAIQIANERQFEAICQMAEEKLEELFKQVTRILQDLMGEWRRLAKGPETPGGISCHPPPPFPKEFQFDYKTRGWSKTIRFFEEKKIVFNVVLFFSGSDFHSRRADIRRNSGTAVGRNDSGQILSSGRPPFAFKFIPIPLHLLKDNSF